MLHAGTGAFKGHPQLPVYPTLCATTDAYNSYGFPAGLVDLYMPQSFDNSVYLNSAYTANASAVDCAQLLAKSNENESPPSQSCYSSPNDSLYRKDDATTSFRLKRPLGDATNTSDDYRANSNKARVYVKAFKSPQEEQRYRERRQKNNEAAKQSRSNRKKREHELQLEVERLRKENESLRKELDSTKKRFRIATADENMPVKPEPELTDTANTSAKMISHPYHSVIGANYESL